MTFRKISCFQAYDIRGKLGDELDIDIVYRVARALSQHLKCKKVVLGFDARESSPAFARAAARGILDSGANVLNIGLAGTEEMYWAVTEYHADAGIEVTASHNPIDFNGMKMVKMHSKPLETNRDLKKIRDMAEKGKWIDSLQKGKEFDVSKQAREKYVNKVLSFINVKKLKALKVLVNCGNGAVGPTFESILKRLEELQSNVQFSLILQKPDHNFPFGVPNPLLDENQEITMRAIRGKDVDVGVAFDGDFDRCFFFDEYGSFIKGEYIVGLLAEVFLQKDKSATIVHDPRVVWNIEEVINSYGGVIAQSKTGHAFFKKEMRKKKAAYGGEMSAHHYFRDFAYCDSGIIPLLLVLEILSMQDKSLHHLIKSRLKKYPSSGEINFKVKNPKKVIEKVYQAYKSGANIEEEDGLSFSFENWRFNIRMSNTEPLVRLNVEAKNSLQVVSERTISISSLINSD